ncbi:sulfotransferase family protein [Streptomyces sp. NPDC058694]|uniref:sulfotransferase family protein n=1 Tax=Streptomyces sp. NPDC058694 TaxID=3346603 RepID=UPI00366091F9
MHRRWHTRHPVVLFGHVVCPDPSSERGRELTGLEVANVQEASTESPAARLLFVGGVHGRTGTSVVKRLLCSHPKVSAVSGGETRMLEAVSEVWPMLDADAGYTPGAASTALAGFACHVRETLGDTVEVQAALQCLFAGLGAPAVRLVGRPRLPLPSPMSSRELAPLFGTFLTSVFRAAALDPSRPFLCEKTPSNAQYVRRLRQCMPDCRVIVMARHPVHAALSHTRRDWGPPDPVEAAAYTAAYFRSWRGAAVDDECVLMVRHERLVAEPRQVLDEIRAFLQLPPDVVWLDQASSEIRSSQDRTLSLPGEELVRVHAELAREMACYGYRASAEAR